MDARQAVGFYYPPNNSGDDDCPGTAYLRSRTISNDTWQNYLGVVGRQAAPASTGTKFDAAPIAPKAGSIFDGHGAFTVDAAAGNDPTQNADGTALPLAKSPLRLRNCEQHLHRSSRCARRRCRADYTTTPAQTANGGAISRRVTRSRSASASSRSTRRRATSWSSAPFGYLLPTTADTTAPTVVGFKYPTQNCEGSPPTRSTSRSPRYDERGDIKEVAPLRQRHAVPRPTGRSRSSSATTPPARAVGHDGQLTAEAEDKAGNVATSNALSINASSPTDGALVAGAGARSTTRRSPARRPSARR